MFLLSQLFEYLLCSCMEQFMNRYPEHINVRKLDDGHTPLHIAAANDHLDIVDLLASMVTMGS